MLTELPHRTTPARGQVLPRARRPRRWRRTGRRGAVLVLFAIFLVFLIGMVGLVVDGALLTATHRQAQNAADAAALAAALDRMKGRTMQDATTTATSFVQTYNGFSNAPAPAVNSPPSTGAYAGRSDYVEVIVTAPVQTYLVHVLGVNQNRQVRARAVAGYEAHSAGEGVMVLNPNARPGLDVGGGGTIRVNGRIVVNSEGGGVDETNQPINNGNNGFAARGGQPNSSTGIFATDIDVVGGVDNPATFKPIHSGDPSPLRTRQLPEPDPLIQLPTPMVASGVDSTHRGSVSVTNNNVQGVPATSPGPGGLNFVAQGGEAVPGSVNPAVAGQVILHPGVYESLSITGGNVYLVPGIYVLSPQQNVSNTLKITGGTVVAERLMFYNTAVSYNPTTGSPDINDGENSSPLPNPEFAGAVQINAGMKFSPIDTTLVNYQSLYPNAPAVSTVFNGMLFFQRRRHQAGVDISGNAASGLLAGTLYAKWSNFQISGQGTYDAQFVAGSVSVTGQGNVTILGAGEKRGKANQIYLVE
jgi:Flp pilus assembly protein TadG